MARSKVPSIYTKTVGLKMTSIEFPVGEIEYLRTLAARLNTSMKEIIRGALANEYPEYREIYLSHTPTVDDLDGDVQEVDIGGYNE